MVDPLVDPFVDLLGRDLRDDASMARNHVHGWNWGGSHDGGRIMTKTTEATMSEMPKRAILHGGSVC